MVRVEGGHDAKAHSKSDNHHPRDRWHNPATLLWPDGPIGHTYINAHFGRACGALRDRRRLPTRAGGSLPRQGVVRFKRIPRLIHTNELVNLRDIPSYR